MVVEGGDLKGVTNDGKRDRLTVTPLADYVARNTRPRTQPTRARILALDIVEGRMAWAKVRLISDSEEITDYLLLYRIGADWKIVTKMFVRSPKAGAAVRP